MTKEFNPHDYVADLRTSNAWEVFVTASAYDILDTPETVRDARVRLSALTKDMRVAVEDAAGQSSALSLASRRDLADLEASESSYARDLAAGIGEWLAASNHAPARVIAAGHLLDSTLKGSQAAHATCAKSLQAADARVIAIRDALATSQADRSQLRGSPFDPARAACAALVQFAQTPSAEHLAGLVDSIVRLEHEACEKASEARQAVERSHALAAQRDAEGARAVKAEAEASAILADLTETERLNSDKATRLQAAERQLAEYRTLLSAMPLGAARAYPAAFPLLKAYLADVGAEPAS